MATIDIHGTLRNLSNKPDIAYEFQDDGTPWPSLAAAHAGCPEAYRAIGKKRYVLLSGVLKEYWYAGGVAIENLVPRYEEQEDIAKNFFGEYSKLSTTNLASGSSAINKLIVLTDRDSGVLAIYDPNYSETSEGEYIVDASGNGYRVLTLLQLFNQPLA